LTAYYFKLDRDKSSQVLKYTKLSWPARGTIYDVETDTYCTNGVILKEMFGWKGLEMSAEEPIHELLYRFPKYPFDDINRLNDIEGKSREEIIAFLESRGL